MEKGESEEPTNHGGVFINGEKNNRKKNIKKIYEKPSKKGSQQKVPNPMCTLIHQIGLYGSNIALISQHMRVSQRDIHKRLLVLERKKIIKIEREGRTISEILLTSRAIPLILGLSRGTKKGSQLSHQKKGQRLHSVVIKFPVKGHISEDVVGRMLTQRAVPFQVVEKKNWNEYIFYKEETTIQITTKHVIITPPEIFHDNPVIALETALKLYCQDAINYVERVTGLEISHRPGEGYLKSAQIMKAHNAFPLPALEKYLDRQDIRYFELRDEKGVLRWIYDKSTGTGEFEAVSHGHYLEDSEFFQTNLLYLGTHALKTAIEKRDKKIKEVESRLHCLENELLLLKQEKKGIFHRIKEMIHKKRI